MVTILGYWERITAIHLLMLKDRMSEGHDYNYQIPLDLMIPNIEKFSFFFQVALPNQLKDLK